MNDKRNNDVLGIIGGLGQCGVDFLVSDYEVLSISEVNALFRLKHNCEKGTLYQKKSEGKPRGEDRGKPTKRWVA